MARSREFDEEAVLDKALRVFWTHGYEGTSLATLVKATGLTKASLYATFGPKEQIFARVRERYEAEYLAFRRDALEEPTPRRMAERLLLGMVDLQASENTPLGCLETNGAVACSISGERVRIALAQGRTELRDLLRDRLEIARGAGPLPPGMTSDDAAFLLTTLAEGMAIQAKSGARRDDLLRLIGIALLGWPTDRSQ